MIHLIGNESSDNSFRPSRETIDSSQDVCDVWLTNRPGSNIVDMDMMEANVCWAEFTERSTNMSIKLGALLPQTRTCPTGDCMVHVWTEELGCNVLYHGGYVGMQ